MTQKQHKMPKTHGK